VSFKVTGMNQKTLAELCVSIAFIVFVAVVAKANWESDLRSKRALYLEGYKDIQILGYAHFGCGSDIVSDRFIAVNSRGERVTGLVCSGIFSKAAVIRTE
jgi:hypothetical protein